MKKIFEFKTTHFDFMFIEHISRLRKAHGFTKDGLSLAMGLPKSFVSNVESYTQKHKYSTRHIALLAKVMGYNTLAEIFNFPTPVYDRIKVTVEFTYNKTGKKVIMSKVLNIEELTTDEDEK